MGLKRILCTIWRVVNYSRVPHCSYLLVSECLIKYYENGKCPRVIVVSVHHSDFQLSLHFWPLRMSLFFLQVQLCISRDIYFLFSIRKHFIKGNFSGLIIYHIVLHRKESYPHNQAPYRKRAPKHTLCSCLDV